MTLKLNLHKETLCILKTTDLAQAIGGGYTAECETELCPPTWKDCPKSVPNCDTIRFCLVDSAVDTE